MEDYPCRIRCEEGGYSRGQELLSNSPSVTVKNFGVKIAEFFNVCNCDD